MRIVILEDAEIDLEEGREFYERSSLGLGEYFAVNLAADIESLRFYAGVHALEFGFHRALSKRFPFGIYYRVAGAVIRIYAVLDLRRDPAWIRKRLSKGER